MLKKQAGATLIGMMIIVAVVGSFATFGLKVLPMYMENMTVKSVIEDVQKDIDMGQIRKSQVMEMLRKRMAVNNVTGLGVDALTLEKRGSEFYIKVDYERRKPLFGSIDLVGHFSDEFRVGST